MKDLISIIVPIFNVESYLQRCVYSLINQTYKNLEIILVDDGSSDNCPEICDKFSKLDERIKVIHKRNGGLSDARNVGLKVATGDYIAFVDSDDWVSTYMFESLLTVLKKHKSDIVECNVIWTSEENINNKGNSLGEVISFNVIDALKELILDGILHQTVWNKLYTRAIIGDIVFEVGKTNEDEYWTYQIFARANNISYVNKELYYYFQRNDSIMGNSYSIKRLDAIEAKKFRLLYFQERFPVLVSIAKKDLRNTCMYSYQKALKYLNKEEFINAKGKITETVMYTIMNKAEKDILNRREKIWYLASNIAFDMVCRIRNILQIGL
jgi:glycosyltransferase involved in cell wall biosynthesis